MNQFGKYCRLKNLLVSHHRGLTLKNVLAFDVVLSVYGESKFQLTKIGYFLLTYELPKHKGYSTDTVLSMGNYGARKDYYEIWDFVSRSTSAGVFLDFNKLKKKVSVKPLRVLRALRSVLPLWSELSFSQFVLIWAKCTFYLALIDELYKKKWEAKKYIGFSTVHPLEAILTLYFRQKHTPTYALQHSIYHIFRGDNIPLDAIAYENFCSDYHFCWGRFTKDEFINYGIAKERLLIGGYPREVDRGTVPIKIEVKTALVLLAREKFHDSNMELFNILNEYRQNTNLSITLKLHPTLDHDEYASIAKNYDYDIVDDHVTIKQLFQLSEFDFSIAVNTGAYYESYIYYTPSLRFKDESFTLGQSVDDDIFRNLEELKFQVKRLASIDAVVYWENVGESLEYLLGLGLNNYVV